MGLREQEGGFVRTERKNGGRKFHRRKASQSRQPRIFKTHADHVAEEAAAHERWAGMPPLAVAREMIAEVNLPEKKTAELLAVLSRLNFKQLEDAVSSGKLAEILAELA